MTQLREDLDNEDCSWEEEQKKFCYIICVGMVFLWERRNRTLEKGSKVFRRRLTHEGDGEVRGNKKFEITFLPPILFIFNLKRVVFLSNSKRCTLLMHTFIKMSRCVLTKPYKHKTYI